MMSNFLKDAAAQAKVVEAARKNRGKLEQAAKIKFDKAQAAYDAALQARKDAETSARATESQAWQKMIASLGVSVELAAQIVGVEVAEVKAMLADTSKKTPAPAVKPEPETESAHD